MNCQNCHLDAGTRIFGNNYSAVASTYPKYRARSGASENIYKRVNDCFERSLNGKALDTAGREMQAIKAYIEFLGSNVEKGQKAKGSGFKDLAFLDRASDPAKGKLVYQLKCQSCHQANGEGTLHPDGNEYAFPPLWGDNSYNDKAGLYRITTFARYVKYNMPIGATHDQPQLTDQEAWDVAAFVNSQPRPTLDTPNDWPDIAQKPIDHPFGPFADGFSEAQHKYGPWKPIQEAAQKAKSTPKS
jgi:thiosulfate dehydrogenase